MANSKKELRELSLPRRKRTASLAALGDWAISHRSSHLYLQVEQHNTAARRFYRRAGFEELCTYHDRTATPS